jgi:hypothetical protein
VASLKVFGAAFYKKLQKGKNETEHRPLLVRHSVSPFIN